MSPVKVPREEVFTVHCISSQCPDTRAEEEKAYQKNKKNGTNAQEA